jgi:hypothetical protein
VLQSAGWLKRKTKPVFSSSVGKYDNEHKTNLEQFYVLFCFSFVADISTALAQLLLDLVQVLWICKQHFVSATIRALLSAGWGSYCITAMNYQVPLSYHATTTESYVTSVLKAK